MNKHLLSDIFQKNPERSTVGDINAKFFNSLGKRVIIYGAGNTGKDIYRILTQRGITVECFLDMKAKEGDHWSGICILSPESRKGKSIIQSKLPIIIAVFNRDVDIGSIVHYLQINGSNSTLTFLDFYQYFNQELGQRFWLCSNAYYVDKTNAINRAYQLWSDDKSINLYRATFDFRLSGDYARLPKPDSSPQYFPEVIPIPDRSCRFVDCGAFDGDTLKALRNVAGKVQSIIAFEPDIKNFIKLSAFIKDNIENIADDALSLPCGVWSKNILANLSSGQGEASSLKMENNDGSTIQCFSLDDLLMGWHPTYVKMDIEGAEYEALIGAENLIRKYRPILTICVYHRPQDIWKIPLLVNQWKLNYKFFLRSYAHAGFETVMYAVPK